MNLFPYAPSAGPADAPTLETDRLILRGHRLEDFADVRAQWADPAVTRFIGGVPLGEEDVWSKMLRVVGHWRLLGFGYWIVREKGSDRFVGEVGFADGRRALDPPFDGAPEIGWGVAPWAHGRGFAGEAVRAIMTWGEQRFGPVRTVCLIHPDNAPSIKLATKLGYREYARTTYKGDPTMLFERVLG